MCPHASTPEPQIFGPNSVVAIQLPVPVDSFYDYRLPDDCAAPIGALVEVMFGPRKLPGIIRGAGQSGLSPDKIKPIRRLFPQPPLKQTHLKFLDIVAAYTMSSKGAVAKLALSVSDALEANKTEKAYLRADAPIPANYRDTKARARVLALMDLDAPPRTASEITKEVGCSAPVVHKLAEMGILIPIEVETARLPDNPDLARSGLSLSNIQENAAVELRQLVKDQSFQPTLLDGVTGSGKTEVYFEAISEALQQGGQILVLLPEIALTSQLLERFARRFDAWPTPWHSDLTPAQRRDNWQAIASGKAKVIVGARSALFLPYPDLKLIVVDEEHEPAFKQEEGIIYHGRDMAVLRASLQQCPILLASATPSLETLQNAVSGRYGRIQLPQRHGSAGLPTIETIDLRRDKPPARRFIAPPLEKAILDTFDKGQQAMLYLNRRGYAPLTLCRHCGHRLQCPHCTAWLVQHRKLGRLVCHHCGYGGPLPEVCPECEEPDCFAACGPEVERIAEEAKALFPDKRIELMVSDLLPSPRALSKLIDEMQDGKIDLLIGTQLMAKGHNFPNLTLVGVVDGDLGLAGGDLRASERTYQLLHQVAGRAGRAEHAGKVLIQTHMPEHPVMKALCAEDRDAFLATESQERQEAGMPPFGRLAALVVTGKDEEKLDAFCIGLGQKAPSFNNVLILGPAPAPLAMLRGKHRRRFLIKADKNVQIQKILGDWLKQLKPPRDIKVTIDIDPYNFL